jgi:Fe2+ transport system protein FeoA
MMESNQPRMIPLRQLPPGVCATVRAIETDDADARRLKTLGLCAGRQVEVIQAGDPMIVRVFGSRLGLAARLAERVQAIPTPARPPCSMD